MWILKDKVYGGYFGSLFIIYLYKLEVRLIFFELYGRRVEGVFFLRKIGMFLSEERRMFFRWLNSKGFYIVIKEICSEY